MAVVIRCARHGAKKKPFYRIVAADKRYSRDGRYLEILGTYEPATDISKLKEERVKYWVGEGAKASPTVSKLIKKSGISLV